MLRRFKAAVYSIGLIVGGACHAEDPVDFAARQIGKPYELKPSAIGPDTFDCSGLVTAAYSRIGITLPHHAASQALLGEPVMGSFQRGDLLFFDSIGQPNQVSHVGIVEGPRTMINANGHEGVVRRDDYTDDYWSNHFLLARRLIQPDAPIRSAIVPVSYQIDRRPVRYETKPKPVLQRNPRGRVIARRLSPRPYRTAGAHRRLAGHRRGMHVVARSHPTFARRRITRTHSARRLRRS